MRSLGCLLSTQREPCEGSRRAARSPHHRPTAHQQPERLAASMAQLEERSPQEAPPPAPQTQLTTVLEEARPVSVDSSQAPTADEFFEETRARGLAALREAAAYLKTTPTLSLIHI